MTKPDQRIPTKQDIAGKPFSLQNNQLPEPFILKLLRYGFRVGGRISPSMAGRMAYKLWFRPTRFKTPEREKVFLDSAKITKHKVNDKQIVTFGWSIENNDLPLVLLIHGWSGRGTQLGPFVRPLLDEGYRVLSFDMPAHGKSSGKETTLFEIADVIVTLQSLYGQIDGVITHSFGGPCLAVAIQNGFNTNRIVSIAPPVSTRGLVDKFNEALHVPEKASKIMMQLFEKSYGESIWEDISMQNTARNIVQPGLVIHDHNDEDIPWQEGQAVAQAWNNAPFIKTTGLGHRRILRDSDVINNAVMFLKNTNSQ